MTLQHLSVRGKDHIQDLTEFYHFTDLDIRSTGMQPSPTEMQLWKT